MLLAQSSLRLSLHFDTKGRRFWIDESFGKNGKLGKIANCWRVEKIVIERMRYDEGDECGMVKCVLLYEPTARTTWTCH